MTETWNESNIKKRWDSTDPYDPTKSTHFWIVERATEVARAEVSVGEYIYDLIKPNVKQSDSVFHDAVCQGLWDADEEDPYRNSVAPDDVLFGKLTATYKSHFYDPDTGKNWRDETTPTALTEGVRFFKQALDAYEKGDIRQAGYTLGLSLHYLTDATQPMHAANFTAIDPRAPFFHGAYETYAIEVQKEVNITAAYHEDNETDPAVYIKSAAVTSKQRYPKICSVPILAYYMESRTEEWKKLVKPEIIGALKDAVAITAQYLVSWTRQAFKKQHVSPSLLKTQTQGFDTVVALSQRTINLKLNIMFESGIIEPTLNLTLPDNYGSLKAKLTAPTITIRTTKQDSVTDPQAVMFILHFTDGFLNTWSGFGPTAKELVIPFSKGDIGFKVNLNFQAAELADAPASVKEAVDKLKNLGLEIFSLQQLVMDLQNANLASYEPEITTLPKEVADNAIFIIILQKYFKEFHSKGGNILGYAITIPTPTNNQQPTFPPTNLTFGTHLHVPKEKEKQDHELDTLYYLVMNLHHPFPLNVMPTGNFIDSDQPYIDGRMAIAKSIFVDQYLIPHLANVVTLKSTLTRSGDSAVSVATTAGHGNFTLSPDGEWNYTFDENNKWGFSVGDTQPADIEWKTHHSSNVNIPIGSNHISVSGTSSISQELQVWYGIKYHAMTERIFLKATIDWLIVITLLPISSSGGLEVNVALKINNPKIDRDGDFLGKLDISLNPSINQQADNMGDALKKILDQSIIQSNVNRMLSGYNGFFFPGANTFDFSDPVFNASRDLIATITIHGLTVKK